MISGMKLEVYASSNQLTLEIIGKNYNCFPKTPHIFKQIFTVKSLGKCITLFSHTRLDSNPPVDASNTSWHA